MISQIDKILAIALHILLESEYWLSSVESNFTYARIHDGIDGQNDDKNDPVHYLSLFMVGYGEICISIPPREKDGCWLFRNYHGGGGQSLRVFRALIVLMEAIRRDNNEPLEKNIIYGDKDVAKALDFILEDSYWIKTVDIGKLYKRRHDDAEGKDDFSQYLSLFIDSSGNSDIHVVIHPGAYRTLRFRPSAGGGKSERVRKALVIVIEAIRRDNEKNPEP